MSIEIELEDGNILEVDDNVDPKDAVRQYNRAKLKKENPAEYDPESNAFKAKFGAMGKTTTEVSDMDPALQQKLLDMGLSPSKMPGAKTHPVDVQGAQFRAGIGSGMIRSGKGLTNLVLPDKLTPEWASDENIREMDERDEPLDPAAKILGGVAATAPLSGGLGALQKGATALSTASKAPALFTKTLASAPARAALEGATQGAIYADPDEQGKGALIGGALGGGLSLAGKAGGRLTRGLVEKSPEALALEQEVAQHGDDIFIPLGQAANKEGGLLTQAVRGAYNEALPFLPFTTGRLEGQLSKAREKLRETALKEALPKGGKLPPQAATKVEDAIGNIKQQFDDAYEGTIKSYSFNVPKDIKKELFYKIRSSAGPKSTVNNETSEKLAAEGERLFKKFSDGKGVIDGTNLVKLKEELSVYMRGLTGAEKDAFRVVDDKIDDIVETELKVGNVPQNLEDLARYKELTPAWRSFRPVREAAKGATDQEGRFKFSSLARKAKNSPEQKVIGQLGREVLDVSQLKGSRGGRWATAVALGGVAKYVDPVTAAALYGTGQMLANKSTQKALMGDLKMQKMIAEFLRTHPDAARKMGMLGRSAVVTGTQEQ